MLMLRVSTSFNEIKQNESFGSWIVALINGTSDKITCSFLGDDLGLNILIMPKDAGVRLELLQLVELLQTVNRLVELYTTFNDVTIFDVYSYI